MSVLGREPGFSQEQLLTAEPSLWSLTGKWFLKFIPWFLEKIKKQKLRMCAFVCVCVHVYMQACMCMLHTYVHTCDADAHTFELKYGDQETRGGP